MKNPNYNNNRMTIQSSSDQDAKEAADTVNDMEFEVPGS